MGKCKAQYIVPHRSYRRLRIDKMYSLFELFIYFILSLAAVYFYIKYIFNAFVGYLQNSLIEANINASTANVDIFGFPITLIDLPFVHTQPLYLFFILIGLVVLFYVLLKQKVIPYNIAMWINFFILVFIIFVLYFIFLGQHFPYSFIEYFELYNTAHIGLMLFSFLITVMAFVLTPSTHSMKITAFIVMVVYYIGYSLARYALTVLLASQLSIVTAPIMFFTLYSDFIFFVALYSYLLYRSAISMQQKDTEWKW